MPRHTTVVPRPYDVVGVRVVDARVLYQRGKHAELELAKMLWKRGYAVMRSPGSGKRYKRFKPPDILAVKRDGSTWRILVFEVKYRSEPKTVYLATYTVESLREYARRSGGEAYLAIKIVAWRRFVAIPIDELVETSVKGLKMYMATVEMQRHAREVTEVI